MADKSEDSYLEAEKAPEKRAIKLINMPDYTVSPNKFFDHILAFMLGCGAGFAVTFVFYKIIPLSIIGGILIGIIYIFISAQNAIIKRKHNLRIQFFDLLEAMAVAMRAGNPPLKALLSARQDLSLIYTLDSDIITELDIIVRKFNSAVPLSDTFSNFAERSGLEDIASFASIYSTIEGKTTKANEIVNEIHQIIADKMEIEMEIDTMMTAAKSEVNIMLFMPLVVLGLIGYAGAGFMDSIYTTTVGRIVSTGGFIVFIISFVLARKFSRIKL